MSEIKNALSNIFKNVYTQRTTKIKALIAYYGTNATESPPSEKEIRKILCENFPGATTVSVEDTSGGCGAMYNIFIEAKEFKGLSIPKQHQAVYKALDEQIKQIHGLHLITKSSSAE